MQVARERSPDVGIRYGATLQSLLRIRSGDSSAHKTLHGEIVDSVERTERAMTKCNTC